MVKTVEDHYATKTCLNGPWTTLRLRPNLPLSNSQRTDISYDFASEKSIAFLVILYEMEISPANPIFFWLYASIDIPNKK